MASKLTPKQEAFCKAYVETGNASEAYRRAYNASKMKPATVNRKAVELLENGKVTARLAELQSVHQKRHEVTVDSLVGELEEARALALKIEAPAPMVAATMGKGKLLGLVVDKNEHTGKDGKPIQTEDVSERAPDDFSRRIAMLLTGAVKANGHASPT